MESGKGVRGRQGICPPYLHQFIVKDTTVFQMGQEQVKHRLDSLTQETVTEYLMFASIYRKLEDV